MTPKRNVNNDSDLFTVVESDEYGRSRLIRLSRSGKNNGSEVMLRNDEDEDADVNMDMATTLPAVSLNILKKFFLPVGFPDSVTPDYLRYQVLNALQAFCNSLAGMLSARAVLEGIGVGDPSASATRALLLNVAQDAFGRLTTIFGAYIFGSSLVPEAKTYRLLADILNDVAVILDTLFPPILRHLHPGFRLVMLCLSSSFRAMCGISAGGSKAAITLHFATPEVGFGDVGDLNAKDASKETVLGLFGMLAGTFIVPWLTTPALTYTALIILIASHLGINYLGVRGLALRSLNRQRSRIAWQLYRSSSEKVAPTPSDVGRIEPILEHPNTFRDLKDQKKLIGTCQMGSSFRQVFQSRPPPPDVLDLFFKERYILWYDPQSLLIPEPEKEEEKGKKKKKKGETITMQVRMPLHLHILFKKGYTARDQLKAWIHAAEVCCLAANLDRDKDKDKDKDKRDSDVLALVAAAHRQVSSSFSDFVDKMHEAGWNTTEVLLMTGPPRGVLVE